MAKPTTRDEFIDYCLRRLGHPVIKINVEDQQIQDRVDDALQKYADYHYDATEKVFIKRAVTATDIANEYLDIPEEIGSVINLYPLAQTHGDEIFFDVQYQMRLNDWDTFTNFGGVQYYDHMKRWLNLVQQTLQGEQSIKFNRHTNRLYIDFNWKDRLNVGDYLLLEGYKTLNPDDYPDIWNDMWLKQYATTLIKYQWGENLIKFGEGLKIPGGFSINGERILEEAKTELEKIEEELSTKFELPVNFFVG